MKTTLLCILFFCAKLDEKFGITRGTDKKIQQTFTLTVTFIISQVAGMSSRIGGD